MANTNDTTHSSIPNEDFNDLRFLSAAFSYNDELDNGASGRRLKKLANTVIKAGEHASPTCTQHPFYAPLLEELRAERRPKPAKRQPAAIGTLSAADEVFLSSLGVRW